MQKNSSGFGIFGTGLRTRVLLAVFLLQETHASELARILDASKTSVRNALDTLEQAGVLAGVIEGRTRRVSLDPRFRASEELKSLLHKMTQTDPELLERVSMVRRRPRRSGKAV
jgi:DNA-binding transcriptional ArsR family regulator